MQYYARDKYDLGMITMGSCYMDLSRDELVELALKEKPDYILFLDADQIYPAETPEVLMKHIDDDKLVVGGLTSDKHKGYPLVYNFGKVGNTMTRNEMIMPQTGIYKVDAMGFGGIMIHPKVFDIIEYPRFQACWNWKQYSYIGEDTKFYSNCKKHEIDVWCDTDLPFGHLTLRPMYAV
jgi:hypothetical protein